MTMRITGGRFRGVRLAVPGGAPGGRTARLRPTSARVREAIFNILAHGDYPPVAGARVLDLFAGTGALALEALSRGAERAVLVDDCPASAALIGSNAATLGMTGQTEILRRAATGLGPCRERPFTLIFADPPYGGGLAGPALASAWRGGWIGGGAVVVLELAAEETPPDPGWAEISDRRTYGATGVVLMRVRMR